MGLAFEGARVGFFSQLLEEIVRQGLRMLINARAESVGAFGAHQGVRVFAFRQKQKARTAPILQARQRGFECAPGGVTASLVTVEAEQYAGHHAKQAFHVFFAGGGPQRGDGIAQALLGEGNHVHVAFHHDDFIEVAIVFARLEQAVEFLAFMKYRGFRGVQVLGFIVPQHSAAESDDPATAVADREHHAVAEPVVALARLGVFHQQAGVDHRLLLQRVTAQVLVQVVPARRGEAEAEVPGDLAREAAALEVIDGSLTLRMAFKRLTIEVGSGRQQRVQRRVGGLSRFVRATAFFARDLHAGGFRQFLDSLGEVQVVVVHDEAEGIAARAAAETVVELLVGADAERRGFFFVKRAAGGVVLASLLHLHARADNIDDVGAVQKVVNKALGN